MGLTLPDIPNNPVVQKISIPGQVEMITLSEYLDIKPELYTNLMLVIQNGHLLQKIKVFFIYQLKNITYLKVKIIHSMIPTKSIGYHMSWSLVIICGHWHQNMILKLELSSR